MRHGLGVVASSPNARKLNLLGDRRAEHTYKLAYLYFKTLK